MLSKTFMAASFWVAIFTLFFTITGNAQTVSGRVFDAENGNPLRGVTVHIPGTSIGTSTNTEGSFSLVVPSGEEYLTFSFVGYQPQRIKIQPRLDVYLQPRLDLEEIIIRGVRSEEDSPVTQTTITKAEVDAIYNGQQPVFYLEELSPAVFSFSESGTKLANYGSMRLRGINQERINITLNGIPLNDMIDHGVFFSNFTDIGNSFESVQIQRGAGTSSNGVASYAGSINFESINLEELGQGGQVEMGVGSFQTYRLNTSLSSGMIADKWSFYGSYSNIESDGFRYNTSTKSHSFFFSGGYFGEKDLIKVTAFDARSKNGLGYLAIAESDLENDPRTNYLNENDKDDFGQRFVQLQHTRIFNERFSTNASLYYGESSGDYFFTFQNPDDSFSQINFPLQNNHYGLLINGFYENEGWKLSSGIHAYLFERTNEESNTPDFENPYYRETSDKSELSWFGKAEWTKDKFSIYGDMQLRAMELAIQPDYDFIGTAPEGDIVKNWDFLNIGLGVNYTFSKDLSGYASFGRVGREPTKIDIFGGFTLGSDNFALARSEAFTPEYVNDYEAGLKFTKQDLKLKLNYFYMDFQDEIAPIGEVIAFGVQRRSNIANSFRTGVEMEWSYFPIQELSIQGNVAYLKSEIEAFTTEGTTYRDRVPVLSPEWIVNSSVNIYPVKDFTVRFSSNYVSESFLELTNDPAYKLPSFFVLNSSLIYQLKNVEISLDVNNLTDKNFYSSGAPVDVDFDGTNDEPGYFVNAGRNVFFQLKWNF